MACFKPSDMEVDFQSFFFLYNEILDSLFLFFANRKYCTIHSNARLSKVCSSILILTYFLLLLRCRFPSSFPITRYYFDDGRFPSSGKSVENEGKAGRLNTVLQVCPEARSFKLANSFPRVGVQYRLGRPSRIFLRPFARIVCRHKVGRIRPVDAPRCKCHILWSETYFMVRNLRRRKFWICHPQRRPNLVPSLDQGLGYRNP
jgi:hypothetical protein